MSWGDYISAGLFNAANKFETTKKVANSVLCQLEDPKYTKFKKIAKEELVKAQNTIPYMVVAAVAIPIFVMLLFPPSALVIIGNLLTISVFVICLNDVHAMIDNIKELLDDHVEVGAIISQAKADGVPEDRIPERLVLGLTPKALKNTIIAKRVWNLIAPYALPNYNR